MHHQTRDALRAAAAKVFGAAGSLLRGQPPLRLAIIAAIAFLLILNLGSHTFSSLGRLWTSEAADTVPVLTAGSYIQAFQVLKPDALSIKYYPKDLVPPGALHTKAELISDSGQYIFSTVVAVPEGSPVTRALLVEVGKEQGLSSLLRLGRVAVSFNIDKSRAAGGWVQPGDTIALFETIPPDLHSASALRKRTQLLMSAVRVLAVDRAHLGQRPDPSAKTDAVAELTSVESDSHMITVLVNPAEAATLIEARERGPLSIVLRAMGDDLPWSNIK
jgi:Flp pilus assembly protein CpaB